MNRAGVVGIVAVLVSAVCAGAGSASAAASTPTTGVVSPNVRVGSSKVPFRAADIPGVAADPDDVRHLVLVDENFDSGQCEFHASFDGGAHWNSGNLTAPARFNNPPCLNLDSAGYPHLNTQSVAFGSNGSVYAVFDSGDGVPEIFTAPSNGKGQGDSVLVAKSSDGGRTFSTAVVVIQAPPGPAPMYVRPTIGVEPRPSGDRVVVAAWGVNVTSGGPADGAGERAMITAVSDNSGSTWSAPVQASGPGEETREPSAPVFGAGNAIYVAWTSRTGGIGHNIAVAKSTDDGATWTRTAAGAVSGKGQGPDGGAPQLGIDSSSGAVYLVYQEAKPYGDQDIWFQRSTDGATTWSTPLRVNDDATGNGVRQHLPHISVASDGRIDVVWFDHRNTYPAPAALKAKGEGNVYYASSSDGGATFSANRRITDRTINLDMGLTQKIGSYSWYGPVVTALGSGGAFIAWSDPRNGTYNTDTNDVFTATLHLGSGQAPTTSTVNAGSDSDFAISLSQLAYPGGNERISNPPVVSRVVLASENDPAEVLAGAVLARSLYGAELVTPRDTLPKAVKDELARLQPAGVYVLGGQGTVSAQVVNDVGAVVKQNVIRLGSDNDAATAAAIAEAMDARSSGDKAANKPAFTAAVIVNPASPEAATAAAFAAALRYPILFSGRDTMPGPTTDALRSLGITTTIVVGPTTSVGDNVLGSLPNATRVGGANAAATSDAVAKEAVARGLPTNLVFVAPPAQPVEAGLMGAAAARTGGLLLVHDDVSAAGSRSDLAGLEFTSDQIFLAAATPTTAIPWVIVIVSGTLAILGLVMLAVATSRRRRRAASAAPRAPTSAAGSS